MSFDKLRNMFKKVNLNVHLPEFKPMEIEEPNIEFRSTSQDILTQLQESNKNLIKTLNEQHDININLQRSNSRISVSNLILVAISLLAAIGGLYLNYTSQNTQIETTQKILQSTSTIHELQYELSTVRSELLLLQKSPLLNVNKDSILNK